MHAIDLGINKEQPVRILCMGAHCDDLEIGCGGTILHLQKTYTKAEITWVVFGGAGARKKEAKRSADLFLGSAAKKKIIIKSFRDSYFPYEGKAIKEYFEQLKKMADPHVIFTHYRHDLHQDHRLISELTWNAFRDHLILEYEIIKYDGDMGSPNTFVNIEEELCRKKVDIIVKTFQSQRAKRWFSDEVFRAIMRLRGVENNSPSTYAEAFYCRKATLSLG